MSRPTATMKSDCSAVILKAQAAALEILAEWIAESVALSTAETREWAKEHPDEWAEDALQLGQLAGLTTPQEGQFPIQVRAALHLRRKGHHRAGQRRSFRVHSAFGHRGR